MKYRIIITGLLTVSLFYSFTNDARLSLKDFEEGTERSGSKRSGSSSSNSPDSSWDDESSGENGCFGDMVGDCLGSMFEIIGGLWLAHNLSVYYSSYPYEKPQISNFMNPLPVFKKGKGPESPAGDQFKPEGEEDGKTEEPSPLDELSKLKPVPGFDHTYFLNAEVGAQWALDNGSGAFVGLSGKIFRVLGPECEYKRIVDGEDHLDYLALGVNLSIVQTNYFSPDLYLQYASMKGVVDISGFAFGLIAHSYPVKPLHLMVRLGKQVYTKQETGDIYREIDFIDLEGRIGLIFNRFEFFAGYRHIETDYAELGGPIAGIRIWL